MMQHANKHLNDQADSAALRSTFLQGLDAWSQYQQRMQTSLPLSHRILPASLQAPLTQALSYHPIPLPLGQILWAAED